VSLVPDIPGLFADEWERFLEGVRRLDPDRYKELMDAQGRQGLRPGENRTISIPGWDDVFKIGPRYRPTPLERDEYYNARRQRRPPQISEQARGAIEYSYRQRERMRRSAQPEWSQGWGSILTALDNVQDFLSTLSTAGRLALWGAQKWIPLEIALSLDRKALALRGAPTAAVIERRALLAAARAGLPVAARLGARFVPVLGWVILASDLMNLLSLAGMVATPLYGVLCTGSLSALSAGVPTALFRRALCVEIWNAARRNPFGREARLRARAKAIGKLPGIGNMVEVLQTTEQLWGWGASFGSVVGMLNEASASAEVIARGGSVDVNPGVFGQLYRALARDPLGLLNTGQLVTLQQAAGVAATAPLVMQHQDLFTVEEHLEVYTAYLAAVAYVGRFMKPLDWEAAVETALDEPLPPPIALAPLTRLSLDADGIPLPSPARWPVPGAPLSMTGRELMECLAPRIADATTRFLARHRNAAEGVFAGATVTMATEILWHTITGTPDGLHFGLSPDYRLLSGLAGMGYLLSVGDGAEKLWPFWLDARAALADSGPRSLSLDTWQQLARKHGVALIKQLPPTAPWPPEWSALTSSP
jgi:hypothetical protein